MKRLQKMLEQFESIIVLDNNNRNQIEFVELQTIVEKQAHYAFEKVLILETLPNNKCFCKFFRKKITVKEFSFFLDKYYLYEFSDRIHVVDSTQQYPSMLNYISNGLLTWEEYWQALLH